MELRINEACLELSISLNHGKNWAMHEINLMIILDIRIIKPCDVGISTKNVLCGQGKILKTKCGYLLYNYNMVCVCVCVCVCPSFTYLFIYFTRFGDGFGVCPSRS